MRLLLVGGVVAAAVGGGATPALAASVTARSGELVAREAPGTSQVGIAVLRGNDRVRLLGEREDWSEILLSDGRRAWVPTAEVSRIEDSPRARESPSPPATPDPAETETRNHDRQAEELGAEIARLRTIVDDLARREEEPAPRASPPLDDSMAIAAGAALIVGIVLGSAWERRRSRRDRALRF